MAPQGISFDASGAAAIDRPVFLYYGEDDRVLLPSENALHVAPLISTLAGIRSVPNADHWVFLAPCSEALATEVGAICRDPAGVDRVKVHAQVHADALAFFRNRKRAVEGKSVSVRVDLGGCRIIKKNNTN